MHWSICLACEDERKMCSSGRKYLTWAQIMSISKENCIVILSSLLAFNNLTILLIQDNFSTVIVINSLGNKKSFRTLDTWKLIHHDISISDISYEW